MGKFVPIRNFNFGVLKTLYQIGFWIRSYYWVGSRMENKRNVNINAPNKRNVFLVCRRIKIFMQAASKSNKIPCLLTLINVMQRSIQWFALKVLHRRVDFLVWKYGQVCPNKKLQLWSIVNIGSERFWGSLFSFLYTYLKQVKYKR